MMTAYRLAFLTLLIAFGACTTADAVAFLQVHGGPSYDPGQGNGYLHPFGGLQATDSGIAISSFVRYDAGVAESRRAMHWGPTTGPSELAYLSVDSQGAPYSEITAINSSGMMVGAANKFVDGVSQKIRAVRWDATGTEVTELDFIAENINPISHLGYATAINDSGLTVGWSTKTGPTGSLGRRAVRWEPDGTAVTELGNLGTRDGSTRSEALIVNDDGIIAGYAEKYADGVAIGIRAIRWDTDSTEAVELGDLGTDGRGFTESYVTDINDEGTIVGWARKVEGSSLRLARGVRWEAGQTTATELGTLSAQSTSARSFALSINDEGTSVGWSTKHIGSASRGTRGVRWDASTTTPTELGSLGTDSSGRTASIAYQINSRGVAVGYAQKYESENLVGDRAVAWGADASALDLNTLIDPNSGWTLERAFDISDSGWITGVGMFDPGGDQTAYERAFLMRLPATYIPEPAMGPILALAAVAVCLAAWPRRAFARVPTPQASGH
ncbi:DUF3466 family protein [Aeoliella sp.]|uniref:DUF3466 family protein n=1 Tax=Aeoliella sp. TaxID=2795800 RepID=UPI003CCC136A